KGIRQFVDIETLPEEFATYLRGTTVGGIRERDASLPPATDGEGGTVSDLRSALIGYLAHRQPLFRVAQQLCFRPAHHVSLALRTAFAPDQVYEEICPFLELVRKVRPRNVLEIGTSKGGSLYLLTRFAHPTASLVSVDLRIPDAELLRSFARRRQQV